MSKHHVKNHTEQIKYVRASQGHQKASWKGKMEMTSSGSEQLWRGGMKILLLVCTKSRWNVCRYS